MNFINNQKQDNISLLLFITKKIQICISDIINIENLNFKCFYNKYSDYKKFGHVYCDLLHLILKQKIVFLDKQKKIFLLQMQKKFINCKLLIKNNFLNIIISKKFLIQYFKSNNISLVFKIYKNYKEKILIEYGSINPNGFFHLGHLRNLLYGRILTNIMKNFYHNVITHFLVNDSGEQINNLCNKIELFSQGKLDTSDIRFYLIKMLYERNFKNKNIKGKMLYKFKHIIVMFFVAIFKKKIKELNLGIIDEWVFEGQLRNSKILKKELLFLFKDNINILSDKSVVLKTKSRNRCLIRKNQVFTYFGTDCLYFVLKKQLNISKSFIVIGFDHKEYIESFKDVLTLLNIKFINHIIIYQLILFEGKRLSKRNNNIVYIDNNININQLKLFILQFNILKTINIQKNFSFSFTDIIDISIVKRILSVSNIIYDSDIDINYEINKFNNKLNLINVLQESQVSMDIIIFLISFINEFFVFLAKFKEKRQFFLLFFLFNKYLYFYKNSILVKEDFFLKEIFFLLKLCNILFIKLCKILSLKF